jgi:hypothetical protein
MALMYTHAAKTAGWFGEVTLIIWGPSAKLVVENAKIREKLLAMQKDGIVIEACVVCANAYGVTEDLKKLGFDVKGMGKPLTGYLKPTPRCLLYEEAHFLVCDKLLKVYQARRTLFLSF